MPKRRAADAPTTPRARKPSTHTTVRKVSRTRAVPMPSAALNPADRHAAIAQIAYRNWQVRGEGPGSPEDDWLRAESEFLASQRT